MALQDYENGLINLREMLFKPVDVLLCERLRGHTGLTSNGPHIGRRKMRHRTRVFLGLSPVNTKLQRSLKNPPFSDSACAVATRGGYPDEGGHKVLPSYVSSGIIPL